MTIKKTSSETDKDGEKLEIIVNKLQRTFDKEVSRVNTVETASSRALLSCLIRHAIDDFDHQTHKLEPRDVVHSARNQLRKYLQGTVEREIHLVEDRFESEKKGEDKDQLRNQIFAAEFVPRLVRDANTKEAGGSRVDGSLHLSKEHSPQIPLQKSNMMDRGRPLFTKSTRNMKMMGGKPSLFPNHGFSFFDEALEGLISQRRPDEFFNGEVLHVNPIRRHLYPNATAQQSDKKCVRIETTTANVQEAHAREAKNRDARIKRDVAKSAFGGSKSSQSSVRQLSSSAFGSKSKMGFSSSGGRRK